MIFKYKGITVKLPILTINAIDELRGNTDRDVFVNMALKHYCCFLLDLGDDFDPAVEFDNDPRRTLSEGCDPWD